jgi:endo-1,4-beta-D-glucanase Y
MALELKSTKHSYYCSDRNYYVDGRQNWGRCDYDTWADFKSDWFDETQYVIDDGYNHLFRFDIFEKDDGGYGMYLFFILQRKGIFRPVRILTITEDDLPDIEDFLFFRWEYLKRQWAEFSKEEEV